MSTSLEDTQSAHPTSASPSHKKTRSRKGSLRKTALLGTGRIKLERKTIGLDTVIPPSLGSSISDQPHSSSVSMSPDSNDYSTLRPSYEKGSPPPNGNNDNYITNEPYSDISEDSAQVGGSNRTQTLGDISTTDEDESLNLKRDPNLGTGPPILKKPSTDAYFPVVATIQRRRSANKAKSPLAALPIEPLPTPDEWDYSETEWWGWVVLIVTWAVFVMGIGSCFEVWSWAWDVGETPYAPPELEDDPTLPIVGYYPALIILTGVMAWVWVVVAWVGMKYFRHAKTPGDDI